MSWELRFVCWENRRNSKESHNHRLCTFPGAGGGGLCERSFPPEDFETRSEFSQDWTRAQTPPISSNHPPHQSLSSRCTNWGSCHVTGARAGNSHKPPPQKRTTTLSGQACFQVGAWLAFSTADPCCLSVHCLLFLRVLETSSDPCLYSSSMEGQHLSRKCSTICWPGQDETETRQYNPDKVGILTGITKQRPKIDLHVPWTQVAKAHWVLVHFSSFVITCVRSSFCLLVEIKNHGQVCSHPINHFCFDPWNRHPVFQKLESKEKIGNYPRADSCDPW